MPWRRALLLCSRGSVCCCPRSEKGRRETGMSLSHVGWLSAFGAGLLSFLSPCVLPLVPGYLSYLAGTSMEEAKSHPTARFRVSLHALYFVLGYALGLGVPFVLVGVLLDRAGSLLRPIRRYTRPFLFVGGVILILMGMLVLTGRLDQLANLLFPFSFSP